MGDNALTSRSDGQKVQADDVNQYKTALSGDFVPRNGSGGPEDDQGSLGSSSYAWSNLHVKNNITLNGNVLDFSGLSGDANKINSGLVITGTGGKPGFVSFTSASTTGKILGASTNLSLVINNASVTVSSDVNVTGLTTAPGSNNTCMVNNIELAGQQYTKTIGEDLNYLPITTIGSEITNVKGTVQCFKVGTEYFIALVDTDQNRLWPLQRGVGQSDRVALSHGQTITLMKLNHIFISDDGTTPYKSVYFPTYEDNDPGTGVANQWYFNTFNKKWYQYSTGWSNVNVAYLGYVICDASAAVASESVDFSLKWDELCAGRLTRYSDSQIRVEIDAVSVAGQLFNLPDAGHVIDLSVGDDLESGQSEAASTMYYIYVDSVLKIRFSSTPPRLKDNKLGMYHPKRYWRCIGKVYNDVAQDLGEPIFYGNASTYIDPPVVPPGYVGTSIPYWVSSSEIKIDRLDEVDSTGQIRIQRDFLTLIDTSVGFYDSVSQTGILAGTISITNATNTVAGTGTSFTSDFIVGDIITRNGGESRRITAITSNVAMTVESNWTATASGANYYNGGLAPNTHYYGYAISDGSEPGTLLSTRSVNSGDSAPILPAGYTYYKQIGLVATTDSSSNLLPFRITGGWPHQPEYLYDLDFDFVAANNPTNILAAGTQTTFTAVDASKFIPKTSRTGLFHCYQNSNSYYSRFRPGGSSLTYGIALMILGNNELGELKQILSSTQTLEYLVSSNTAPVAISVRGYILNIV